MESVWMFRGSSESRAGWRTFFDKLKKKKGTRQDAVGTASAFLNWRINIYVNFERFPCEIADNAFQSELKRAPALHLFSKLIQIRRKKNVCFENTRMQQNKNKF